MLPAKPDGSWDLFHVGPRSEDAAKEADGEIFAIYILKAFHGRKIGRSLIAAAARFWLSKGGRNLIVLSMAGNTQATAFYEALGGVQVYEGSFEIAGTRMADKGHLFSNLAELAAACVTYRRVCLGRLRGVHGLATHLAEIHDVRGDFTNGRAFFGQSFAGHGSASQHL